MYDNNTDVPGEMPFDIAPAESGLAVSYKVSVTGPGVSIEKDLAPDQLFGVLSIVLGGTQQPATASLGVQIQTPAGQQPQGARPPVSLREFLNNSAAKTIPQKLLAMAVYNNQILNRETIGRDDFRPMFQRAGEALPGNFARDLRLALAQGWLEESHAQPDTFYVTATGEDVVANSFEAGTARTTRRPRRKTKRTAKPKADSTTETEE